MAAPRGQQLLVHAMQKHQWRPPIGELTQSVVEGGYSSASLVQHLDACSEAEGEDQDERCQNTYRRDRLDVNSEFSFAGQLFEDIQVYGHSGHYACKVSVTEPAFKQRVVKEPSSISL
jgi:hypothetical protein